MTGDERYWADYSEYTRDRSSRTDRGNEFTVTIAGKEFVTSALSTCGTTLAVDVYPEATSGISLPAEESVTLSTPEETVTVRLSSITFDYDRTILSFERLER